MSGLHAVSTWLHLASLSFWLGGIVFFLVVFAPAVRRLPTGAGIQVLERGRRSFEIISWLAITIVVLSGAGNLLFRGLTMPLGNDYLILLAVKLFLFLAMLLHHFFQVLKYSPQIASLTSQAAPDAEAWPEPLLAQWKKWFLLLKINAALGPIVLLLGLGLTS